MAVVGSRRHAEYRCPHCGRPIVIRIPKGKSVLKNIVCPNCESKLIYFFGKLYDESRFGEESCKSYLYSGALETRGKLREAEKAYKDAVKILSDLDKKENRQALADAFNEILHGYGGFIKESDFEGARLKKEGKVELTKRFGIRVYPLTIIIPREKWKHWDEKSGKYPGLASKLLSEGSSGSSFPGHLFRYPFNKVGGLRIGVESGQSISEHEDLHGSYDLYVGVSSVTEAILTELFAYRINVERGENSWNDVKDALKERENFPNVPRELIDRVCDTMKYLHENYDDSVISRVIIKSRSLEDFIEWVEKRKSQLDEWQQRAERKGHFQKPTIEELDRAIQRSEKKREGESREFIHKLDMAVKGVGERRAEKSVEFIEELDRAVKRVGKRRKAT
jgi:DNA-directed RNA polymerase subunit RPC12/RpoP/predicted transcriptional regulator